MLGSDAKKIEFFQDFEMWDQLRALYGSKSRWFELFTLLMDIGELSEALRTIMVHGLARVVEKPIMEKLAHYTMAQELHARPRQSPDKPGWFILLTESESAGLEKIRCDWIRLSLLLDTFNDPECPVTVEGLELDEVKNFFCLFVS
jgi:hypothetical protein